MGLPRVSHGDPRRLVTHTTVQCAAAQLIFAALVGSGSGPLSLPILLQRSLNDVSSLGSRYLTRSWSRDSNARHGNDQRTCSDGPPCSYRRKFDRKQRQSEAICCYRRCTIQPGAGCGIFSRQGEDVGYPSESILDFCAVAETSMGLSSVARSWERRYYAITTQVQTHSVDATWVSPRCFRLVFGACCLFAFTMFLSFKMPCKNSYCIAVVLPAILPNTTSTGPRL